MNDESPDRRPHDPSKGWTQRMIEEEAAAAGKWSPGMTYQPHDGEGSDFNLHYADMFAGPNLNVPDIMADWPPDRGEAGSHRGMTVVGYQNGVAYTVQCDPGRPDTTMSSDRIEGVVTHASPTSVMSLLASEQDHPVQLLPMGTPVRGGTHSCLAVLATLMQHTEVVRITGDDVPQEWSRPGPEGDGSSPIPLP